MRDLSRRSFLLRSAAALAATRLFSASAFAQAGQPVFDISLAQWSLHRAFFSKKSDPLEFATISSKEFGIQAVEYVNQFYKDHVADEGYLKQLKQRQDDLGVKGLLIMCDGEGQLGDPDSAQRAQAVSNHQKWLDMAAYLGCHSIRVNASSSGSYPEQQQLAADGLRQLSEKAATMKLNVIVENHGGLSSNGAWLAGVMEQVNLPNCGTLPDFGNFRVGHNVMYDRYDGVAKLMPFAKGVSAKSHEFNESGEETATDYRKMLSIVLSFGYHGYVGIEYEGSTLGEPEGILATKKLLETVRAQFQA